jgi:transcriptional regulator with XRE-family HTH domain
VSAHTTAVNHAQVIKSKRLSLGWSVQTLAFASGVSHATITRYEAGKSTMSEENLRRVMEALYGE